MASTSSCARISLVVGRDHYLETNPERLFLANADIENKGLLAREVAKKRLSGFISRLRPSHSHGSDRIGKPCANNVHGMNGPS